MTLNMLIGLTLGVLATILTVKSLPVAKQDVPSNRWRIHITMHVFSGRHDPTWFVEDSHSQYIPILKGFKDVPKNNLPTRLGYRGFKVVHLPPGKRISSGNHVNVTVTSSPYWEMMLLDTAELNRNGQLYNHAKDIILETGAKRKKRHAVVDAYDWYRTTTPSPLTGDIANAKLPSWLNDIYNDPSDTDSKPYNDPFATDNKLSDPLKFDRSPYQLTNAEVMEEVRAMNMILNDTNLEASSKKVFYGPPAYEPEKWNNWLHLESNNCYNYANNEITDTMAQPGRATSCSFSVTHPTGIAIRNSSVCDGLHALDAKTDKLPAHDLNLVALVFWPPEMLLGELMFDFHWYRLDDNGLFSHKPGKTEATNVDNSGNIIKDPRKADRGPYTEFVGFMETRRDKIKII